MTRTRKSGTCTICGKVFPRSDSVKAHMMTHTNERPFKCAICGSTHRSKSNFNKHSRYVHGDEKRSLEKECILCKKTMTRSNLNRHLRMHIREKPYSCSICDQEFVDNSNMNIHFKSHGKLRGDPCVFCGKTFSIRSKPENHLRSHIKEKPYFCKSCPSSFSQHGPLGTHIRNVHLKERRFSCGICKKMFYSRSHRDIHLSTHLHEKPFQCTICAKRYKTSMGLKGHLRSHNDEQEPVFSCKKCNKVYRNKKNFTLHDKEKHQLTECIFCEKNITTDFMAHLLKHTKERPFPCNSCDKDFQTLNSVTSHVSYIHSTERPYPCEICGKSFTADSITQNLI